MIGILVVEDERIVAMALEKALRRMRYSVVGITDSGQDAVRKATQTQPDVVLMDIRLRGPIDGIEAAAQIQSQGDVPIVYLTAYADDETLQQAKITEPYGYVLKPFEERGGHHRGHTGPGDGDESRRRGAYRLARQGCQGRTHRAGAAH